MPARSGPTAATAIVVMGVRQPPIPMPTSAKSHQIACARAGFTPRIAFEASDPRTVLQFAAHGLGVAVVTAAVASQHGTGPHIAAINRPRLHGQLALAWRKDGPTSHAGRAIVAHAPCHSR